MLPPTYNISCNYSCVTFVSLFINLRHPREFTSHTSRRGTLCIYINVFFWHIGIFLSSGRGSFLVLSAPWHAGSPPGPRTQVWALAEVRGTSSGGSKWLRSGMDSDHGEAFRPLQAHVQVKRMPDGSCNIWNLECHQCRQTILTLDDGKVFPNTNMPDMRPLLIQ